MRGRKITCLGSRPSVGLPDHPPSALPMPDEHRFAGYPWPVHSLLFRNAKPKPQTKTQTQTRVLGVGVLGVGLLNEMSFVYLCAATLSSRATLTTSLPTLHDSKDVTDPIA